MVSAQGPCPKCGVHIGPMSLGEVIADYDDGSRLFTCSPEFNCRECGQHITEFLVSGRPLVKAREVLARNS